MQRGGSGARSLNIELQKVLNPDYYHGITKFGQTFAVGDKVMQTENNYDKDIYNGDIGVIALINHEEQEVTINFYGSDSPDTRFNMHLIDLTEEMSTCSFEVFGPRR